MTVDSKETAMGVQQGAAGQATGQKRTVYKYTVEGSGRSWRRSPGSGWNGEKGTQMAGTIEPRTTPEMRAELRRLHAEQRTYPATRRALRARYDGHAPNCPHCGREMSRTLFGYPGKAVYACTFGPLCGMVDLPPADPEVLAACDDADALDGALAEMARYRAALAFYADPATYLARWPEPHDQATFEEARIEADRGTVARAALDLPQNPVYLPHSNVGFGAGAATTEEVPASREIARQTRGIEG